ncbi:hypothetical protein R3P38DRAFT_3287464 [Favolaschia claudopus]|uniref:Uncharacterized protein n=1 Tax=Favolaschia claudopus TaxID=2862362 RepID=A0AAV9ZZH8_9AGAR
MSTSGSETKSESTQSGDSFHDHITIVNRAGTPFPLLSLGASMLSFGSFTAAYGTVFSGVPYAVAAAYKSRPGLRLHAASRTLLHVSPRLGIWWGTCMSLMPLGTYAVDRLGMGSKEHHPLAHLVLPSIVPVALSFAILGRHLPPGQPIAFSVNCGLMCFMMTRGPLSAVGGRWRVDWL